MDEHSARFLMIQTLASLGHEPFLPPKITNLQGHPEGS